MMRRAAIIAKVLSRVTFVLHVPRLGECWIWDGPTSGSNGRGKNYPRMSLEGVTVAVHRVIWVCFHGYLPTRKQLDHLCRQRMCVNPDHLEPVTHKKNCKRRDCPPMDLAA